MWANCFKAGISIVKDSFHRIGLRVQLSDDEYFCNECSKQLLKLSEEYSGQIHLSVDLQQDSLEEARMIDSYRNLIKQVISSWSERYETTPINQLIFLSVICTQPISVESLEVLTAPIDGSDQELMPSLVVFSLDSSKEEMTKELQLLKDSFYGKFHFGLTLFRNDHDLLKLQYVLDNLPSHLVRLIYVGEMENPSYLFVTLMHFIHARGIDMLINLPESYLTSFDAPSAITAMAEKYKKPELAILTKVLLQLGYLVTLSVTPASTNLNRVSQDYLFLEHPFVYRREFVAPTKIFTFAISNEEIWALQAASEELEASTDVLWEEYSNSGPERRLLRDDIGDTVT